MSYIARVRLALADRRLGRTSNESASGRERLQGSREDLAKLLLEVQDEKVAAVVENLAAVALADQLVDVVDRLEEVQLTAVAEGEVPTDVGRRQAQQR